MRSKLPIPLGGLSDNEASADQPLGTTSEALNVRGLDPVTGRRRLSQRAGSSKLTTTQLVTTGKVDAIAAVTYDVPRVSYTQETSAFEVMWEKSPTPGGSVYDTAVDRQGNVFALTVDGTVTKKNSKGVLVDTIQTPLPAGYLLVQRIAVDEIDHVYVAGSFPGGTGYVWKFIAVERPDGATVYEQRWEISTEYGVLDFDVRAGRIAVLGPGNIASENHRLRLYTGVWTSFPLLLWSRVVPNPSNAARLTRVGDVVMCSEPNDKRLGEAGGAGGPYAPSLVDWVPHEEFEQETRFHAWFDAQQILGLVDGDRVLKWEDRRFVATTLNNPSSPTNQLGTGQPGGTDASNPLAFDPPEDVLANRYLATDPVVLDDAQQHEVLQAPTYSRGLLGGYAAVRFDGAEPVASYPNAPNSFGGNIIQTRRTSSSIQAYKSDSTGNGIADADGSNALLANSVIPGHHPYLALGSDNVQQFGNGFTMTIAVQLPPEGTTQYVIWASQADSVDTTGMRYALVYNGRYNFGFWDNDPTYAGRITLYFEDGQGSVGGAADVKQASIDYATWNPNGDNPHNFAIISFVHGGHGPNGVTTGFVNQSSLRVNGHHGGNINGSDNLQSLSQELTVTLFGGHRYSNLEDTVQPGKDFLPSPQFSNFTGFIFECLIFLHPDDNQQSNDLNTVTSFGVGWGNVQPTAGGEAPGTEGADTGTLAKATYAGNEIAYTISATTVERLEGYLAHKLGHDFVLPDGTGGPDGAGFYVAHPFGGTRVPTGNASGFDGTSGTGLAGVLNSKDGILAKFSGSNGTPVWALDGSGLGYGIALDPDDNVLNVGPVDDPGVWIARKVIDLGKNYSADASDGAWELTGTTSTEQALTSNHPKLLTDTNGDLYWPYTTSESLEIYGRLRKLSGATGATLWEHNLPEATQRILSVAFPRTFPFYNDDTITGPEFAYVSASDGSVDASLLYKLRLVSSVQDVADGQSLRRHDLVVIGQGDIKQIQGTVVSTPAGGEGALLRESPYAQAVQLFGQVFISDGESYKVFDPRAQTVVDMEPEDGGELPLRARIFTAWRGRLIAARAADDPYEIYASELGNPYGWNIYPAALSVTQAWRGRAAGVGRAPDIVNAFIPMTDDVAFIGGDHSIFRMTGDPAAGGDVDVVTDQVGIAFGDSWTKDPFGRLFFFSSRGGVYVMHPQGGYDRVSVNTIERRLQAIDLREYKIRMVWDYRREGLWVLPVPWTIGGVAHRGYFWESKTNAWWEDDWSSTGVQPSAITTFDGDDPDDRKVVFGCEDGYVRFVDEAAKNDDGVLIDSRVLVGPLVPSGQNLDFRFMRPQIVLASEQDGTDYELLSSDVADTPGVWWAKGRLEAGRSEYMAGRTRGAAVWFRLRNNKLAERWSLEDATISVAKAGRNRVR